MRLQYFVGVPAALLVSVLICIFLFRFQSGDAIINLAKYNKKRSLHITTLEEKAGEFHELQEACMFIVPRLIVPHANFLANETESANANFLYNIQYQDGDLTLNLTKMYKNQTSSILEHSAYKDTVLLASNFIVQHLSSENNDSFLSSDFSYSENSAEKCLYFGTVINNRSIIDSFDQKIFSPSRTGSAVINFCRGLFGIIELPDKTFSLEPSNDSSISNNEKHNEDELEMAPDGRPHVLCEITKNTATNGDQSAIDRMTENSQNDSVKFWAENVTSLVDGSLKITMENRTFSKRSTAAISHDYYVEVLVVVDSHMKNYHQENLENYVLTLLSIVSTVYRHPTLEAAINIVLTKLIILDDERVGPRITKNVQETLRQFCTWQLTFNDNDENSVNHHDVAILLTRLDMCRAPGKCDTLGLAELGTMCDFERSCSVVEDNGLSAAFTIAHELGHIFNIPHDDEKKCSEFMNLESLNFHIMAPTLEYNTHPWSWSPCSMNLLHNYLASEKSTCLFNKPVRRTYAQQMISNPAPGLNFSVHQQCQYIFGPSSQLCPYMPVCKLLWCTSARQHRGYAGCRTQHTPWADGTPCANDKWCYRGECVSIAPGQLIAIDGAWGQWQEWSGCSRTCGGGVRRSGRNCDYPRSENGGKYCVGQRIRSVSCNILECPDGSTDYREAQCSEFNKNHSIPNIPLGVDWIPKVNGVQRKDTCKLYCTLNHRPDFYLMRPKVVDGTPCGLDIDGVCVDGICEDVGCDGHLGSDVKRDLCGVCGGNGENCVKKAGSFNESTFYGYNTILTVPSGASNLDIRQQAWNGRSDDDNYLALYSDSGGKFILNGHFQVTVFEQKIRLDGMLVEYSGSDSTVERINATKQLKDSLTVYVLSVGQLKPPQIMWEYTTIDQTLQKSYQWRYSNDWTDCDSICQGISWRKILCYRMSDNVVVEDAMCKMSTKQQSIKSKSCNDHCKIKWHAEPKSTCSVPCGSGEQDLSLFCAAENSANKQNVVTLNDSHCSDLTKPPSRASCFADCSGFSWKYDDWTKCSVTCGRGVRLRKVRCTDGKLLTVKTHFCEQIVVESLEEFCSDFPCPAWYYGPWSRCSTSCGIGMQLRSHLCMDYQRNEIDGKFCDQNLLEEIHKHCNLRHCTRWKFGTWSQCSQSCGNSTSSRTALCLDDRKNSVPETSCTAAQKITSKPCLGQPCPLLSFGEWSECSKSCGCGEKNRRALCSNATSGQVIKLEFCNFHKGGVEMEKCNAEPCPAWIVGNWSECPVNCTIEDVYQTRYVYCSWPTNSTSGENYCNLETKPAEAKLCAVNETCKMTHHNLSGNLDFTPGSSTASLSLHLSTWNATPWSQCSQTCGEGYKKREVTCQNGNSTVSDALCFSVGPKPPLFESCLRHFCGQWHVGEWQRCPATCGQDLLQYRPVTCVGPSELTVAAPWLSCDSARKPSVQRPCRLPGCQLYAGGSTAYLLGGQVPSDGWRVGPWGQCSRSCGGGWKQRLVVCDVSSDPGEPPLGRSQCPVARKPVSTQSCGRQSCPQWIVGEWNECNVTCGTGTQERVVECVDPDNGHVMTFDECAKLGTKPISLKSCSPRNCDQNVGIWKIFRWSRCSIACGRGLRKRTVQCTVNGTVKEDNFCTNETKPAERRHCRGVKCPRWRRRPWSECSSTCGIGVRTRTIECVIGRKLKIVSNSKCAYTKKPATKASCTIAKCEFNRWTASDWTKCTSESCDSNRKQSRKIHCTNKNGQKISPRACKDHPKPSETINCKSKAGNCSYFWLEGTWTQCSKSCGRGVEKRNLTCFGMSAADRYRYDVTTKNLSTRPEIFWSENDQGGFVVGSEDFCENLPKPNTQRPCVRAPCDFARKSAVFWNVGEWSKCSSTCGQGVRYRKIQCVDEAGKKINKLLCLAGGKKKPSRIAFCQNPILCHSESCKKIRQISKATKDGLYLIRVGAVSLQVHCHGMSNTAEDPSEYLPLPQGENSNMAENYGKRLLRPFTCPFNGQRNDSCACTPHGSRKGTGLSQFKLVRLDLQRMVILTNDFRFAKKISGDSVPYATAGDCYSALQCPQGIFNVDLRGTGFRVSNRSTWITEGYRTTLKISWEMNGTVINGHCGGFCGRCYPDPKNGLLIELDNK